MIWWRLEKEAQMFKENIDAILPLHSPPSTVFFIYPFTLS
jgi:hypothetical protein